MIPFDAVYLKSYKNGALNRKVQSFNSQLLNCNSCGYCCNINRHHEKSGNCNLGKEAVIYGYFPNFSEEPVFVGENGSGTIYFSNLTSNYSKYSLINLSLYDEGRTISNNSLAEIMLFLQGQGCHNINLINPVSNIHAILSALEIAIPKGLKIPLIYTSNCYESVETLKKLNGIIDIYAPNFSFFNPVLSSQQFNMPNYQLFATKAIQEMYNQVGDLITDDNSIAQKGLVIHHSISTNDISSTRNFMEFIATNISKNTYIKFLPNIPSNNMEYKINPNEYSNTDIDLSLAIQTAMDVGITRISKPKGIIK